jgi:hypothetical protein
MRKLSHFIDTRDSFDALDSRLPSPLSANTSAPASPALSFFSSHNRVSSSVSSLVPSVGNAMDSPNRNPLSGVKEEDLARDSLEDQYFRTSWSCARDVANPGHSPANIPLENFD